MSDPVKCHFCSGNGWVPVQVCCGNPVIGAEYMGAQEHICCGEPEEDTEPCHICKGTGEIFHRDTVSEGVARD